MVSFCFDVPVDFGAGGGGGVITRVGLSEPFFEDALVVGAVSVGAGGVVAVGVGTGKAVTACTTGLSGCVPGSGLSVESVELDESAMPKIPSNKTAPPAAPAATINCFFVAAPRPASDAVPENVG